MRGVSARAITAENIVEAMNREVMPILRTLRNVLVDGGVLPANYVPVNFARIITSPATKLEQVASIVAGIDEALGIAMGATAATAALVSELIRRSGSVFTFMHPGQSGANSRRMYPGFFNQDYNIPNNGWAARVIIPDTGHILSLSVQNPMPSLGMAETATYTVYLSTDNGATFLPTQLNIQTVAGDTSVHTIAADPPLEVPAGSMIGVQIDYSGIVIAIGADDTQVASVRYRPL